MKTKNYVVCLTVLLLIVSVFYLSAYAQDYNCEVGQHNDIVIVRAEPTATTDGYEILRCQICQREFERILFATSCMWGPWEVINHPTCTEAELRRRTCFRTGNHHHETESIQVLGHDYQLTVIEPTCDEPGLRTYTCFRCGHSYTEYIPASGHTYAGVVTREPACMEEGVKTFTCAREPEHNYIEIIPALGHDFGEWTVEIQATPGVDGLEARLCFRCGEWGEERIIPALIVYEATEIRPLFNGVDKVAGGIILVLLAFALWHLIPIFGVIRKERKHYREYNTRIKAEEMEAANHGFHNIGQ